MRTSLKVKRVAAGLTSAEASEAIGTVKQYWSLLETGKQRGTIKLWKRVQDLLDIPDEEMWKIINEE